MSAQTDLAAQAALQSAGFSVAGGQGGIDLGSDAGDTTLGAVTNTIGGINKGLNFTPLVMVGVLAVVALFIYKKVK